MSVKIDSLWAYGSPPDFRLHENARNPDVGTYCHQAWNRSFHNLARPAFLFGVKGVAFAVVVEHRISSIFHLWFGGF